jgi:hypothetical protein
VEMCNSCRGRLKLDTCGCVCPFGRLESVVMAHVGMAVTCLMLLA